MVKCRAFFLGKISRKIRGEGGEDAAREAPAEVGAPSRPGARWTLTVVWADWEEAPRKVPAEGPCREFIPGACETPRAERPPRTRENPKTPAGGTQETAHTRFVARTHETP